MADDNYQRLNSCAHCSCSFPKTLKLDGLPRLNQPKLCGRRCESAKRNGIQPYIGTIRHCVQCGQRYEPKHNISMYCSKPCKVTACKKRHDPMRGKRLEIRRGAAIERLQRDRQQTDARMQARTQAIARRLAALRQDSDRTCRHCSVTYCAIPVQNQTKRTMPYCSIECGEANAREAKKAERLARKLLLRASQVESVNALRVFRRDGWCCYLCGIATPQVLRGTQKANAPELEHMTPVSRGGAHSYANVRCACKACNAIKGDRTLDEIGGPYVRAGVSEVFGREAS